MTNGTTSGPRWTNFVKSGDPNGDRLPSWPAFDDDAQVLHLGDSAIVGSVPNVENLRVFDAVYAAIRGKPFGENSLAKTPSAPSPDSEILGILLGVLGDLGERIF